MCNPNPAPSTCVAYDCACVCVRAQALAAELLRIKSGGGGGGKGGDEGTSEEALVRLLQGGTCSPYGGSGGGGGVRGGVGKDEVGASSRVEVEQGLGVGWYRRMTTTTTVNTVSS
jgi:hypothetical protein